MRLRMAWACHENSCIDGNQLGRCAVLRVLDWRMAGEGTTAGTGRLFGEDPA